MPNYQCIAQTCIGIASDDADTKSCWSLSDPRSLEPLTSAGEVSGTCPSNSSSRDSLRSASVSAPTFIENPVHVNIAASQFGEGVEEQPQSGSTRLSVKVAFVDDYQWKTSKFLDRETQEDSKGIPQAGTSAVLAIK